ncbi:MAG TPA: hypothetical protein VMU35_00570 [Methylomirabilota bacterium]|nr:hypothetical protein [Methylomirabilota bacterium]
MVKPTETAPRGVAEVLMLGGYLPDFELTLRLGREIQNEWMNAYQDVQISNTFKKILRMNLRLPMPSDA